MTLGGMPQLSDVQYTPIIQQSYYVINVTDTLVNGVSVGVPASTYATWQSVVDSGTTGMIAPASPGPATARTSCVAFF
jgi:hypothetical protein